MQTFEKTISNLVESQFPAFYLEEGPNFVEFVRKYYEWMEEQNVLYHSRRLLDYRDIDTTIDSFIIHFKNKYLNSIQFDTAVDTRSLVKHSLDLYRSKGTERSMDLFFRSVFGSPASIYYPGEDIFKTSDGEWIVPRYLEVHVTDNIKSFIGLQIEGVTSGATAFVEGYITKRMRDSSFHSHLYYINNVVGTFQRGEYIRSTSTGSIGPVIRGSLSELSVINGSAGYSVGDIVDVWSESGGIDAKARVTGVSDVTGKIQFTLMHGGWGYNSNSSILIADSMLALSEVSYDSTDFEQFETVVQPLSSMNYTGITGTPVAEDGLYKIDSLDGSIYTEARVMSITQTSATDGTMLLSIVDGKSDTYLDVELEDGSTLVSETGFSVAMDNDEMVEDGFIYSIAKIQIPEDLVLLSEDELEILVEDHDYEATVATFNDVSAYGNLIQSSANITILASLVGSSQFANGNFVYQTNGSSNTATATILVTSFSGTNVTMSVTDYTGAFMTGGNLISANTGAAATVLGVSTTIGVVNTENSFTSANGNYIYSLNSNVSGTVDRIGTGFGASFITSNTLLYEETVPIPTDKIAPYVDVELDAADYGFPAEGTEDIDTIIDDALTYASTNVGKIYAITATNFGDNYDTVPYVVLYNKEIARFDKKDWIINISNNTGSFTIGEVVEQANTTKAIIKSGSNSSVLFLERITFGEIETTSNIRGVNSGATANVVSISADASSDPIGFNALVRANTAISTGSVSTLEITDSGFAYDDFETVSFSSATLTPGEAEARILTQGKSEGYYRNNNSVLSGKKKLQDGEYYQEYSYEIRSGVVLEKYSEILKSVMHMAGTKQFSKFVVESSIPMNSNVSTTYTVD